MTATTSNPSVFNAAAALAQSIHTSPEWLELLKVQKASKADASFARMVARHNELADLQKQSKGNGQGLDRKSLVEFIALRDQLHRHELYVRQQEAWDAVVALLGHVNETLSRELGFDFASTASPRKGGCCG